MSEVLIKVENVSKKFCKDLKRSLWYGMTDIARSVMGGAPTEDLREGEFWAVRDVSFEVRRGECLGLIGHNGAGKSTLLKMLNGLINPDEGRIEMHGKIGALIELGAGFNPILTGRENVYNNGAVLGFSKAEIDRKFDDIVAFAEIEDFIDMPVQNYSSGMKVRLGFAIAVQMEPDILLIDEVLAVGDMGFIMKCFNRMDELIKKTAVIFVSHSMPQVHRISTDLLLLQKGIISYQGSVSVGIDEFYKNFNFIPSYALNDEAQINEISVNGMNARDKNNIPKIQRLSDLEVRINCKVSTQYPNPFFYLVVYDKEQRGVAEYLQESGTVILNNTGEVNLKVIFPKVIFSKGVYSLTIAIISAEGGTTLIRGQALAFFQVLSESTVWTAIQLDGELSQELN